MPVLTGMQPLHEQRSPHNPNRNGVLPQMRMCFGNYVSLEMRAFNLLREIVNVFGIYSGLSWTTYGPKCMDDIWCSPPSRKILQIFSIQRVWNRIQHIWCKTKILFVFSLQKVSNWCHRYRCCCNTSFRIRLSFESEMRNNAQNEMHVIYRRCELLKNWTLNSVRDNCDAMDS